MTNPNWQDETWRGKQNTLPNGWIYAKCSGNTLMYTSIPVRKFITNWLWRNGHAEPIFGYAIPDTPETRFRDNCIAAYEERRR